MLSWAEQNKHHFLTWSWNDEQRWKNQEIHNGRKLKSLKKETNKKKGASTWKKVIYCPWVTLHIKRALCSSAKPCVFGLRDLPECHCPQKPMQLWREKTFWMKAQCLLFQQRWQPFLWGVAMAADSQFCCSFSCFAPFPKLRSDTLSKEVEKGGKRKVNMMTKSINEVKHSFLPRTFPWPKSLLNTWIWWDYSCVHTFAKLQSKVTLLHKACFCVLEEYT